MTTALASINSCISSAKHSCAEMSQNCSTMIENTRQFVENHKLALFVFSTLITSYYSFTTTLVGGLVGYAVKSMQSQKPVQSNDDDSEQQKDVAPVSQEPFIDSKKALMVTLGAVGALFPIPTLSVLLILAGAYTIGSVGYSIKAYYSPQN